MKFKEYLKSLEESSSKIYTDEQEWRDAVLAAYPDKADRIKFKGRVENRVHTISAEIPGEDKSYGVYDGDKDEGRVL